jgi:tetratricopeptide (TPR) repeat protein
VLQQSACELTLSRRHLAFAFVVLVALSFTSCQRDPSQLNPQSDQPERATLLAGMGSLHHPIHTSNPECQKFFDQGLTLTYSFNFQEALASFRRAADIDRSAAMPYWGIALTLGPNFNAIYKGATEELTAFNAIQKAKKLSITGASEDRELIVALSYRFTDEPDFDAEHLARSYANAMHDLSMKFSDDPDASALYAESLMDLYRNNLWSGDGKQPDEAAEIESLLEGALQRWPNHLGLNHYYVHLMEGSSLPSKAYASAKRLETLAPGAGHIVHMPAHIYFNCGAYADAVKSASAAAVIDQPYLDSPGPFDKGYAVGYAQHNIRFLMVAAAMDGEFNVAQEAAESLASAARGAPLSWPSEEPLTISPVLVLLRFARWDDILALPKPQQSLPTLTLFWHFARSCAFAEKRDIKQAREEQITFQDTLEDLPTNESFGMLFPEWTSIRDILSETLDARIASSRGDGAAAIEHWTRAVSVQDRMHYHEPPAWYPVRESLGAALLLSGRAREAESVFRKDLLQHPSNPRSLFGLQMSLQAQMRLNDAAKAHSLFEEAWKGGTDSLHVKDL